MQCLGGSGNLQLLKNAKPTRRLDIHKQASIPPRRKIAPDNKVPVKRPAAFAM